MALNKKRTGKSGVDLNATDAMTEKQREELQKTLADSDKTTDQKSM